MATKTTKSNGNGHVEVTFNVERETPGTWRYLEEGPKDKHLVGTLYLKKDTFEKLGGPQKLRVAIAAA